MRIARILPGIAVLNGRVFVCGGEVDSQILANGEIYNPHEDNWSEMAAMTIPRCEFGMCALEGYLYAFGGLFTFSVVCLHFLCQHYLQLYREIELFLYFTSFLSPLIVDKNS